MKTHERERAEMYLAISSGRPRAMMPSICLNCRQFLRSSSELSGGRHQKFQSQPSDLMERMPRRISLEKKPSLAPMYRMLGLVGLFIWRKI